MTPCLPGSSWPIVPWLPCSATRVFSTGDFLRLIWSTWRGIPGAMWNPGYDTCLTHEFARRCFVVPCLTHGERDVLSQRAQWRPSVPLLRQHMSAAAFAYQPQQAAARTMFAWVLAFTRLHPGLSGERLLKQRPKPCSCFRRPRGCGALPRRRSWLLERILWVPSSQRGKLGPFHVGAVPFETPVDPGDHVSSALLGQCPCAFRCIARAIAS